MTAEMVPAVANEAAMRAMAAELHRLHLLNGQLAGNLALREQELAEALKRVETIPEQQPVREKKPRRA